MISLSILYLLLSNAVTLRRDMSILFNRIAIIVLIYCFLHEIVSLSLINKGIGLHGGLLHISSITQIFHIFVFAVTILILQLTSFYPRKVWVKEYSSLKDSLFNNLMFYRTNIINKIGEHLKIIEYPLILLFVVSGAIFLMSTNDLVSIFLSIELQSYGLYLLSTIYRNSELATTGGLIYFLLGGLSSCFIVRLCVVCYYESKRFKYYPYIFPATELGKGESPMLNIASLSEGGTGINQICPIVHQAESSMSRAILPEPYSLGTSTWGLYHFWNRIYALSILLKWKRILWIKCSQDTISIHNVKSGDSKEELKVTNKIKGLPTALKSQGNRGIVVPLPGRVPEISVCMYSTTAGGSSLVSTNGLRKIQKIRELCVENKEFIVTDKLYKILYDKELYYVAYNKLKSKSGNKTPGIIPTTLDGLSNEDIDKIIQSLKDDTFKFQPEIRVHTPKAANEGDKPLTIAPPKDKLVQECIRMILESVYEPSFSDNSHGFRPHRSCHSALRAIRQRFVVAKWFIEGDISKCFNAIDHDKLMNILAERIKDPRFLSLIRKALKVGYMEFRKYSHSVAGTFQGSIISPILANIYLNKLDSFIAKLKEDFDIGNKATTNPTYRTFSRHRAKSMKEKSSLHKTVTPSKLSIDPNFKKLEYIRYAHDWIIGIRGSKKECVNIMGKIKDFLKNELDLELSETKTKITNTSKEVAEFLSVRIKRSNHVTFSNKRNVLTRNVRNLRLTAPIDKITKKLAINGFMKENNPYPKFIWIHESKDTIILWYNSVYRGIIQYYRFADNFNNLSSKVHYILKNSCARLLTAKFKAKSQRGIYAKYGKNLKGKDKHSFVDIILGINTAAFNVKTNRR